VDVRWSAVPAADDPVVVVAQAAAIQAEGVRAGDIREVVTGAAVTVIAR
jgi:hypothetical protein